MRVLVGPAYIMDVPSGVPAAVQDSNCRTPVPSSSSSTLFLNGDDYENEVVVDGDRKPSYASGDLSDSSSSSVGAPGDTDEDDEVEDDADAVSGWKKDGVRGPGLTRNKFCMGSFQDSLPNNRRSGLSNHYSGKSKSFGNLAEVVVSTRSVKEIEKEENPLNKRRRVLIANKWSRQFFYSRLHSNKSMPLLPALPDDEDNKDQQLPRQVANMGVKSRSCFCLADLQEEPEDEQDQHEHD